MSYRGLVVTTAKRVAAAFALGGLVGWILENATSKTPRNSYLFGKRTVPFLPVYAVGAAGIVAAAPFMSKLPLALRGGTYALGLSALELGACKLDRASGTASWSYPGRACVDLPHAALWGALGLAMERFAGSRT
jgi:hypothetical protein